MPGGACVHHLDGADRLVVAGRPHRDRRRRPRGRAGAPPRRAHLRAHRTAGSSTTGARSPSGNRRRAWATAGTCDAIAPMPPTSRSASSPAGPEATRVEIEHRRLGRLGAGGEDWRDRNHRGWDTLPPHYLTAIQTMERTHEQRERDRARPLEPHDGAGHLAVHDAPRRAGRPAGARLPGRLDDAALPPERDRRPARAGCARRATGSPSAPPTRRRSPSAGTVEAWGRSPDNPVGGWYGLRKGYRGRFGMYLPPLLEALGLAEVTHDARNNRMRAL